ncbi:hypothetical protein OIU76_028596 [Salix suchowensis]|nr:hypothetical protein OIU76_028596 [Salix suchowensis]
MQDSVKLFQELKYQDIIAWNALISGFVHNGLCQEAIRAFFSGLIESKPNQYSFGSVLNAIGAAEDVSLKYGQSVGAFVSLKKFFVETPQQSQFAWTAIISAHARHGDYESVMNWFEEMRRLELRPDSITFLSILTACGRKGMVDTGCHLFGSMVKDYQIEPSAEHYSCMVDMLGRAGRLEEAERLMSHIPGGPGISVLQSLLGACRVHRNVDMGERVADALMEMDPSESGSYVLMSNLYAEIGKWEMVAKLRKGMRVKGVKKEIGFSWVDVGGIDSSLSLHGFSSGDKSHPQSEAICWMAECLGFEMKFLREDESVCQKQSLICDGDLVTPQ